MGFGTLEVARVFARATGGRLTPTPVNRFLVDGKWITRKGSWIVLLGGERQEQLIEE